MHLGVDNFVSAITDRATGRVVGPEERLHDLLDEITLADQSGVHSFGIGEHHRPEFYDSSPVVVLAAAAARTTRIRLNSAVLVLSAADPVRVFQEFSTLDLISHGRTDLVVGRGSFTEAYPLFGLDLADYASLFEEKLDLLLRLRAAEKVTWSGRHRPALVDQGVYPRPAQDPLPVWVGVGGTPESFVRAGLLGLPLVVAIIGGEPRRFAPLIDLYRRAGAQAGHAPETLRVGLHLPGFVAGTDGAAREAFFPGWLEMMTRIGRERGFPPPGPGQFEAQAGPEGAFVVGAPGTVASKLARFSEQLGCVERISLQMTNPQTSHAELMRSIEHLGTSVVPELAGL